jgi:hypothetical protein
MPRRHPSDSSQTTQLPLSTKCWIWALSFHSTQIRAEVSEKQPVSSLFQLGGSEGYQAGPSVFSMVFDLRSQSSSVDGANTPRCFPEQFGREYPRVPGVITGSQVTVLI